MFWIKGRDCQVTWTKTWSYFAGRFVWLKWRTFFPTVIVPKWIIRLMNSGNVSVFVCCRICVWVCFSAVWCSALYFSRELSWFYALFEMASLHFKMMRQKKKRTTSCFYMNSCLILALTLVLLWILHITEIVSFSKETKLQYFSDER